MSKIGQKSINVPPGVNLEIVGQKVKISGPMGEINLELPEGLTIEKNEKELLVKRKNNEKKVKSTHGLYRQLLSNAIIGVEKSWEKRLEVVGTGYNVKMQGEDMLFKIGYSHPVVFKKQEGVKYKVEGNNKIVVSGSDKQLVGQVAYQIKLIKKPDVYKGKGVKYEGEKLRIKPGKKAKAAGAAA